MAACQSGSGIASSPRFFTAWQRLPQEDKSHCANASQASAGIILAKVPLARTSHKAKGKVTGHERQKVGFTGGPRVYHVSWFPPSSPSLLMLPPPHRKHLDDHMRIQIKTSCDCTFRFSYRLTPLSFIANQPERGLHSLSSLHHCLSTPRSLQTGPH